MCKCIASENIGAINVENVCISKQINHLKMNYLTIIQMLFVYFSFEKQISGVKIFFSILNK